ncbi:S-layer homology domain-containing protein [Oscillospiraceae bacterium OttesenSCG-928-G22]|nr:S-layer homology domain-containing protein [Oscillospiraceae bacterium OttesenSCG-928-G22]
MKRILSVVLVLVLALSAVPLAAGAAFSDVPADREMELATLQMLGVISGFPDGAFRPDATLTRAQFCKMIVVMMGKEDQIGLYKAYTIYPDVLSKHWASGYINLAVKDLKLILGFSDGTFKPDREVTFAEGVTILMRALGYTDEDVGAVWPTGYISKAAAIGLLDGVPADANARLSRLNGARLFYNLLAATTKDGKSFSGAVSAKQTAAVIILDNNASIDGGAKGAVKYQSGEKELTAETVRPMPDVFVGRRGTLLFDANDKIVSFIPEAGRMESLIVREVTSDSVTGDDGKKIKITDDETTVFIDGKPKKFIDGWIDIKAGRNLDIFYTSTGAIDYMVLGLSSVEGALVLAADKTAEKTLLARFGAPSDAKILKNGAIATSAHLKKYDVVSYQKSTNTVLVTDFKLSGILEYATPNMTEPRTVRVLGNEFEVLPEIRGAFSKFKLGTGVTLLLTTDGRVAGVLPQADLRVTPTGLCKGTTVEFINGPTITVPKNDCTGKLVRVTSPSAGQLRVTPVTKYTAARGALDLEKNKMGDIDLLPGAEFFEQIGTSGFAGELSRSNIDAPKVNREDIIHVEYDSSGRVLAVVLDDVTGDLYEYGRLSISSEETEITDSEKNPDYDKVTNPDVPEYITVTLGKGVKRTFWVTNSDGTGKKLTSWGDVSITPTSFVGIAGNYDGSLAAHTALTRRSGLTRDSFVDAESMVIDGVTVPIAEKVHVFMNATNSFVTGKTAEAAVNEARAYSNSFDVYLNKAPEEGGKIRIIIVR